MVLNPTEIRQLGKYPVTRYLASGGMSWVFEVTDPDLFNAVHALKLLKPEAAVGDELQRFLGEAKHLATIQHPNLVHVYDIGQDSTTGCHFYTMDFISGMEMAELRPDWLGAAGATQLSVD